MTKEQEFRKQTEEAKFEAFSLMCKKVAELEKENAEQKEQCLILADCNTCTSDCKTENIEMKKQLSKAKEIIINISDLCAIISSRNTSIEDEVRRLKNKNAELKEELKNANEKVVHLACNQNKDLKNKFAKAKELLKQWLQVNICDSVVLFSDTEQFLKDSEVEK